MKQPWVLALMGLPGAGKTALAQAMSCSFDVEIISRDDIRSAMFKKCTYTVAEKRAAFSGLLAAIEVAAQLGRPSIVDGVAFSTVGDLEAVVSAAQQGGARPLVVWLDCPVDIAVRRVEDDRLTNKHTAVDRDAALVRQVNANFRAIPESAYRLDATLPLTTLIPMLTDFVERYARQEKTESCKRWELA